MSDKSIVMLGLFIGSIIGGYIPTFFGVSVFSYASVIWSGVGSVIGVYVAYKFVNG